MQNELYHLHIPKTGGSYLRTFLENEIYTNLNSKNINEFKRGHAGWDPVNENSYIVTSIRNPIARTVSHFLWQVMLLNDLNLNSNFRNYESIGIKIKDIKNPSEKEFLDWFEKHYYAISNFQSRNFFNKKNTKKYSEFFINSLSFINTEEITKELVFEKIEKTSIMIKDLNLNNNGMLAIQNKIFIDFSIDKNIKLTKDYDKPINTNNKSTIFLNSLSSFAINYIEQNNKIDFEVYNTDRYFIK